jgi:hypothetical protein
VSVADAIDKDDRRDARYPAVSEVELAPPSTALGKLQRGRGAGWIEAAQHRTAGLLMAWP